MVKDADGCTILQASIDDGKITQPDANTLEISIPESEMALVCPGSYRVGCVYELNDEINQIFVGSVSIFDGVATL